MSKSYLEKEREPFSPEKINLLFQIDQDNPNYLVRKESNHIEYKQSFHFESFDTHARTIAAFANTNGGYLVFGVIDETRELVSLVDDKFEKLDPRIPTEFLNSKFSPEIQWTNYIHKIGDKIFGIIYVWASENKPIIAISNGVRISEGQIFYRYRGRTETIKYPELRDIFEECKRKEQELWLRHLKRLASIGVENAAIFNPLDGTVTGKGGTFVIDSSLLPKLQFIREGEFKESEGAPAIRIVGDAEILAAGAIAATEYKLKPTLIREPQIIENFLNQINVVSPSEFIKAVCFEKTPYLPVYYYAYLAKYSYSEFISFIDSTQGPSKQSLLNRINEDDEHNRYYSMPKSKEAALKRQVILDAIINKENNIIENHNPVNILEVMQILDRTKIDKSFVLSLLISIYKQYWNEKSTIRTFIRKAICHLDYIYFKPLLQ